MYSIFCILPCVEIGCKRLFLMQKHSNEQDQALFSDHSQYFFEFILHLTVYIKIFIP